MAEEKNFKGRRPDYSGDGVAVWFNTDKNGKTYLAIKLVGHNTVSAFLPKTATMAPDEEDSA